MEQLIRNLYIIIFVFLLVCCIPESDRYETRTADSYIYGYIEYYEMDLSARTNRSIMVSVKGVHRYGAFSTYGPDLDGYEAKCRKYSDYGYQLTFSLLKGSNDFIHMVPDRDFKNIEVFSDKMFDDCHPAGSNLSDCFFFASVSPYKYIKNGYRVDVSIRDEHLPEYFVWDIADAGFVPVYGVLSELREEDFILLGISNHCRDITPIFELIPIFEPSEKSVHTLTVRIEDTEGFIFKKQIRVDFSE